MRQTSRYFLKYYLATGELIFDKTPNRAHNDELLVVRYKITLSQGKRLENRLKIVHLRLGRILFLHEVEQEFYKMFHVCKTCGFVSDKVRKEWNGECQKCFRHTQELKRIEYQRTKDYRKQIRKYKLHMKTLQGQIDSVPIALIESNVKLELKKQGKTIKNLADGLCLRQSKINEIFANKTIKKEYLLEMAEFLFVPVEKFLRLQRGVRIPYKDGVPKFWLDDDFVIRNYDDGLKGKF